MSASLTGFMTSADTLVSFANVLMPTGAPVKEPAVSPGDRETSTIGLGDR